VLYYNVGLVQHTARGLGPSKAPGDATWQLGGILFDIASNECFRTSSVDQLCTLRSRIFYALLVVQVPAVRTAAKVHCVL
jgi:hypothetical protein